MEIAISYVYTSRKWKQLTFVPEMATTDVYASRKLQQCTCLCHGNYNNVRVCIMEMLDPFCVGSFSRGPQDCYNHMEEVCLQFRRCYIKK